MSVPRDAFVGWELAQEGKPYRNDEHRCEPDSPTHDCTGLPVASMRANGDTGYPCRDSYQFTAVMRASGRATSVAVARATKGYVLLRGGTSRDADPHGHMSTSLGDGRTIEAYDTADGIIIGHVDGRVWNDGGPMDGVDYSGVPGLNPGPRSPGEAKDMNGITAAKIVPGSHVQKKPPWLNRYPFIAFVKQPNLTTDVVGFNGARITNPADPLNPHGATSAFGMSIYHLGVLRGDVEDCDEDGSKVVGLGGDGGTYLITVSPVYL